MNARACGRRVCRAADADRANALGQYLFVNQRPVRDKLLLGAVRAAYADYLPRDRHPLLALFVSVPPREVDVNVHPAKAEVRFRNAGLVRALIVHALKEALARDSTRAATTGGSAAIAAFRSPGSLPFSARSRSGTWDWRRSPARPGDPRVSRAALRGGGFAERHRPHSRSARPRPITAPPLALRNSPRWPRLSARGGTRAGA